MPALIVRAASPARRRDGPARRPLAATRPDDVHEDHEHQRDEHQRHDAAARVVQTRLAAAAARRARTAASARAAGVTTTTLEQPDDDASDPPQGSRPRWRASVRTHSAVTSANTTARHARNAAWESDTRARHGVERSEEHRRRRRWRRRAPARSTLGPRRRARRTARGSTSHKHRVHGERHQRARASRACPAPRNGASAGSTAR